MNRELLIKNGIDPDEEVKTPSERIKELEGKLETALSENEMLTECILEMSEIIYA